MDIEKISALARQVKAARNDAYTMTDYARKRSALAWLNLAQKEIELAEIGQPLDEETATANIEKANRIIKGADKQERIPQMATTKTTQPVTDPMAAIAQMMANQTAMMAALMEKVNAPASAPASAPAKPKSAIPDPSAAKVKSVSAAATATRATASTVVFSVADHSILWADRGISVDRKALESLGNPSVITITISEK